MNSFAQEVRHARTVQWLSSVPRNGYVYSRSLHGQYWLYDNAYVDVKPGENCPDCGRPTETVTEEIIFSNFSAFQQAAVGFLQEEPNLHSAETRATKSELRRRRPSRSQHHADRYPLGDSCSRRRASRYFTCGLTR